MRNFMIKIAAAALVAAVAAPAMAQSGSGSGASGASGSAGLGIDYAALVAAGASGNPGVATPGQSATGTLGGPIAGLINQFSKKDQK
ncbi:MAG TPA: hypothetical protein VFM56_15635 [Solimonas sp.]|jgi:hypothetical protein|nr:hypothetical protein [Solimonas sp.]